MAEAFFIPAGDFRFEPTENLPGPWHPGLMHGGPPSALMAHSIFEFVEGEVVPPDPLMTRLAVEFIRPVPVEPVEVSCEMVRTGKKVALIDATMTVAGREVMRARAWLSRTEQTEVPGTGQASAPPEVPLETIDPEGWSNGYLQAVEWGWVEGTFEEPGPATVWASPKYPLVEGRQIRPEELVTLIVDSGSGISAVASPTELTFVNVDLVLHQTRRLQGDRLWMRSETFLDPSGTGLATTVVGDGQGQLGTVAQSLFVART